MATFSLERSRRHTQRYREIAGVFLRHGFDFWSQRLGSEWRLRRRFGRSSAQDIASVPAKDPEAHLRQALEELGPTFVKLGQYLSTRPDLLPPSYIAELSKLQDAVPPLPWDAIREVITQELGHAPEDVFAAIDPQPLGAASLGQVHAATLSDGTEVVVKVQRPNIQATISTDLEILQAFAAAVQPTALGQVVDSVTTADNFAFTLRNELDYRREGRNADRFQTNFAEEPLLYIPRVYGEYTTSRVLVLERIRGVKLDDLAALDAAGYDRHRIAEQSARMVTKEMLDDGFFHADPHPGNFVVMPNEVIGAMDFGKVGYLTDRDRLDLTNFYIAVVGLDSEGIVEQLVHMSAAGDEVDRRGLAREADRLLAQYHYLQLKDIRLQEVMAEVMPIAQRHHLHLPANLVSLATTLAMTEGVVLTLDPEFDVFAFSEPYVRKLGWRMVVPRRAWGYDLLRQGAQWGELIGKLPHTANRLLEKAERGELLQVGLKEAGSMMAHVDRLVTRLALALLLAALNISLALLIPVATGGSPLRWPVTLGFVAGIVLTLWVVISILRGTR